MYLIDYGFIEDCSRRLSLLHVYPDEITPLSDVEISSVLNCFDVSSRSGLRNICFVLLMLDCGLRRGEIPRINIGDIHFNNQTMIARGKGGKQRLVPLGDSSTGRLKLYKNFYRDEAASSEPFFINRTFERCSDNLVKQVFQQLKDKSGIERLHPHLLRHTFATNYICDGAIWKRFV